MPNLINGLTYETFLEENLIPLPTALAVTEPGARVIEYDKTVGEFENSAVRRIAEIGDVADKRHLFIGDDSNKTRAYLNGQECTGLIVQQRTFTNVSVAATAVSYYPDIETDDGRNLRFGEINETIYLLQKQNSLQSALGSVASRAFYYKSNGSMRFATPEQKGRLDMYLQAPLLPLRLLTSSYMGSRKP